MPRTLPQVLAVSLLTLGLHAHAADPVTDAMQAAYAPYRAALFTTNGQDAAAATQALAQARAAWSALTRQHGAPAATPAPYDRDPAFTATLAQVDAVYAKAAGEVAAGRLPAAHETLEAARDLMADLRRRNQVIVFSDHMNAYHAEMEHVLQTGPALAGEPQGPVRLMAPAGALAYLARRLKQEAPAALQADPQFTSGLAAVLASVDGLQAALLSGDTARIRQALGQLKAPYSKLFLKFG